MLQKFLRLDNWSKLVVLFLWSGTFLGKASAYIGLAIGGLLIFSTRVLWDRWYLALTRRSDPLNGVAWPLLVSLLYGFAQVIYGTLIGHPLFTALQILVFNLCPVYLFLGLWVGFRHPGIIRKLHQIFGMGGGDLYPCLLYFSSEPEPDINRDTPREWFGHLI